MAQARCEEWVPWSTVGLFLLAGALIPRDWRGHGARVGVTELPSLWGKDSSPASFGPMATCTVGMAAFFSSFEDIRFISLLEVKFYGVSGKSPETGILCLLSPVDRVDRTKEEPQSLYGALAEYMALDSVGKRKKCMCNVLWEP